jgi:RNA polymerase sigma-70 factor (ECF subfamily)
MRALGRSSIEQTDMPILLPAGDPPMARSVPREAFEEYYQRRASAAARYAATILGEHRGDVDDALQEAWARAWRAWESAEPQRVDAWFFRIVRNVCLDHHRRRGHAADRAGDRRDVLESTVDQEPHSFQRDAAWDLLRGLPPHLAEILWLRGVLELSYAEIAALLRIPVGTVMSRLHAARRKAVRHMGRHEP